MNRWGLQRVVGVFGALALPAAFIGAVGLGERIVAGLAGSDTALMLAGALPGSPPPVETDRNLATIAGSGEPPP